MNDHMNERSPIDFSALGPPVPAERFEAGIARAIERGAADLQRRRGSAGVVRVVIAWRRPVLVLSGLAAAAAAIVIASRPAPRAQLATTGAPATVAEAIGIPAAYAEAVEGRAQFGAPVREQP